MSALASEISNGRSISGDKSSILTEIYRDDINMVVWQRKLASILTQAANHIIKTKPVLQISTIVTPHNAYAVVNEVLGTTQLAIALSEDIIKLVELFCGLFEQERAGLRLTALDHAMCPRFHVDRVACRLVTTYQGTATQWLPHHLVDRSKLGAGNQGEPDEQSGLFEKTTTIQQLSQGDVALLKGERWKGNAGAGVVHRSPQLENDTTPRLLLTLDFIDD